MSPFIGTANPEELAIMSEAFDGHCLQHNLMDETDKSNTAHLVMLVFEGGAKTRGNQSRAQSAAWRLVRPVEQLLPSARIRLLLRHERQMFGADGDGRTESMQPHCHPTIVVDQRHLSGQAGGVTLG